MSSKNTKLNDMRRELRQTYRRKNPNQTSKTIVEATFKTACFIVGISSIAVIALVITLAYMVINSPTESNRTITKTIAEVDTHSGQFIEVDGKRYEISPVSPSGKILDNGEFDARVFKFESLPKQVPNNIAPKPNPDLQKIYDLNYYLDAYGEDDDFIFVNLKLNNFTVAEEYQRIIYNISKRNAKHDISFIRVLAHCYKEGANNDPFAIHVNPNGTHDIGIMQINWESCSDLVYELTGSNDWTILFDPVVNVRVAVLKMIRDQKYDENCKGNLLNCVMAYNGGPGNLARYLDGELPGWSAVRYGEKVIEYMGYIREYILR